MKKALLLFSIIFISLNLSAQKSLFNGENLDGWSIYGTELWYVEEGILICESGLDEQYGYLSTDKYYKNFELTLEFKQETKGNSGVFIRSKIEGVKVSGWQVEVAQPGHYTGGVHESFDRGWLIKPGLEKDKALKMGEWNQMRIKVINDTITTWLNGTEMVTITDEKISTGEGSIVLQVKDGGGVKVNWKNLNIIEL